MKFKTTKKAIKESYKIILGIGYCDMQTLLRFDEPFAYSSRAEGWACDYYDIENICISTGYNYIDTNTKKIKDLKTIVRSYENKAREVQQKYLDYETTKQLTMDLLKNFIDEIKSQL